MYSSIFYELVCVQIHHKVNQHQNNKTREAQDHRPKENREHKNTRPRKIESARSQEQGKQRVQDNRSKGATHGCNAGQSPPKS